MLKSLALLAAVIIWTGSAWAYDPTDIVVTGHELPQEIVGVGVDEHLGAQLDLSLPFTDDKGETGPLSRFFSNGKPALMAIVYYSCPSLCNYHLNGLTETMKKIQLVAGRDFNLIAVSMLSTEKPELAATKKHNYLKAYGHEEAADGWHFLVGTKENIASLATQFGFRFKWLEDKQQFSHASVAYVVTPTGKISRYLHGIQPEPQTLRLSLIEAGEGRIGSVVEQAMMFCFQFNPAKGKYTLYAWNLVRIGAIVMVLLLAVLLIPLWWRDNRAE